MTALQMEKELLSKWHTLPKEKQQTALEFIQFLDAKTLPGTQPLESALGLCADLKLSIEAAEIDKARHEAWSQFPREDF